MAHKLFWRASISGLLKKINFKLSCDSFTMCVHVCVYVCVCVCVCVVCCVLCVMG